MKTEESVGGHQTLFPSREGGVWARDYRRPAFFSSLTVRSTTDTSATGTRNAIPVSLLKQREGICQSGKHWIDQCETLAYSITWSLIIILLQRVITKSGRRVKKIDVVILEVTFQLLTNTCKIERNAINLKLGNN